MRTYYIYKQTAKQITPHDYYSEYRWMPYEYIGYVTGTKELYNVMRKLLYGFPHYNKIETVKSFNYSTEVFRRQHGYTLFDIFYYDFKERILTERYAIVDDKGNFRDYYSLVEKYRKRHKYGHYKYAVQVRMPKYVSELRNSITPEESRELKENYGYTLPSKTVNSWDVSFHYKISRCWKDQRKRKHQWKEVTK